MWATCAQGRGHETPICISVQMHLAKILIPPWDLSVFMFPLSVSNLMQPVAHAGPLGAFHFSSESFQMATESRTCPATKCPCSPSYPGRQRCDPLPGLHSAFLNRTVVQCQRAHLKTAVSFARSSGKVFCDSRHCGSRKILAIFCMKKK